MIVGTTIFKMGGNPYYTPQFPRGGLAALFSVQAINLVGAPTITVTVEHRPEDDTAWTPAGTFQINAVGPASLDVTNIQELVRLKFTFGAGDPATAGMHFFLPAPAWRPYP